MERTEKYRKDQEKENLLELINEILEPIEREIISGFDEPKKPTLFIVGAPRSATTLIHQLVAETGVFGYISNYLARFWAAPYIGGLQEKAFCIREKNEMSYKSDFGRTKGWHEPHQFNYFWEKWFQFDSNHQMNQKYIDSMGTSWLVKEISALENVFGKPIVFKSLYCGLQIRFLKETLKKSKFVICTRNPIYQAQSILSGRKAFFGTYEGWFSLKPPEFYMLKNKHPFEQVIGQIYYILRAIGKGLKMMNSSEYLIIKQEDLIRDPRGCIRDIIELANQSISSVDFNKIPDSFENRNTQKISEKEWKRLEIAIKHFFDGRSCYDVLFED